MSIIRSSEVERLTWNPDSPAPFESGWSIILKTLALNYIDLKEFAPLIATKAALENKFSMVRLNHGGWIDFAKFGELLEVSPARLKLGFLDQVGVDISEWRVKRQVIRNCPKCFQLGFHCTFFDWALIQECPWHRLPLTTDCQMCGQKVSASIPLSLATNCRACAMPLHPPIHGIDVNELDLNFKAMVAGYGYELKEWWAEVCSACARFSSVKHGLLTYDARAMHASNFSILLSFAHLSSKNALHWKIPEVNCNVKQAAICGKLLCSFPEENDTSSEIEKKIFKSVRRYVYRNFVKKHRKCLQQLENVSYDESYCLEAQKVCPMALSYLAWWMSVEGVSNIEHLRIKRNKNIPLRLPSLNMSGQFISLEVAVQLTYFSFFGIYQKLYECIKNSPRFLITMESDPSYHRFIEWEVERNSLEKMGDGEANDVVFRVLSPDILASGEVACSHSVHKMMVKSSDLFDIEAYNSYIGWYWDLDRDARRRVLFRFVKDTDRKKVPYVHVVV